MSKKSHHTKSVIYHILHNHLCNPNGVVETEIILHHTVISTFVANFFLTAPTLANNSCCCLRSSSSGIPRFSSRELAFLLFKATVLHSCSTSFTSVMYDAKPRLSRAVVLKREAKAKLLLSVV